MNKQYQMISDEIFSTQNQKLLNFDESFSDTMSSPELDFDLLCSEYNLNSNEEGWDSKNYEVDLAEVKSDVLGDATNGMPSLEINKRYTKNIPIPSEQLNSGSSKCQEDCSFIVENFLRTKNDGFQPQREVSELFNFGLDTNTTGSSKNNISHHLRKIQRKTQNKKDQRQNKQARHVFLKDDRQVSFLEYEFSKSARWSKAKMQNLSNLLGLHVSQIYKWNWDKRMALEKYRHSSENFSCGGAKIFRIIRKGESETEKDELRQQDPNVVFKIVK